MESKIYKHYATGEERTLIIKEVHEKYKVGHDPKTDEYLKIVKDIKDRWKINKTSYFEK